MSVRKLGLLAFVIGAAVIWALPAATLGQGGERKRADDVLREATQRLGASVQQTVNQTTGAVRQTTRRSAENVRSTTKKVQGNLKTTAGQSGKQQTRAPAADPQVQPPLRGDNPHGQGTVGVVDVMPSAERPFPDSTDEGADSGEETIVGRSRGEQQADGSYRGHITILELFGSEVAGVNTVEGEAKDGPLQPLQEGVLDPLCTGSGVCLQVLTAKSSSTSTGSSNDFAVTRAAVGGPGGLTVGAAESNGTITEDANCQTSTGSSRAADVRASGNVVASAASSSSTSKACRGQAEQTTQESSVINLGGTGVPLPDPGCANGTPDTRFSPLSPLAVIVCNADEQGGSGTRQALDVFVLSAGGTSLAQDSTAQAESKAVAPPETGGPAAPQCSDGVDNDGDGVADAADPGCHTDGNANNPASFNPNDNSEANAAAPPGGGGGGGDDDGDKPQCSDGRDNDGDGVADERDPGCHTDGNADNAASFDPDDDDERNDDGGGAGGAGGGGDGDGGARDLDRSSLPFTGTDVIGLALAGLLVLAGGLVLRRREDLLPR